MLICVEEKFWRCSGNSRLRKLWEGLGYYGNRSQSRHRPQKNKIFHEDLLVAVL
jgi:hypothetical protein